VLWVGMPPMRDPGLNAALMHLNDLVQIQVAQVKDHGASFLSSTPSLVDKKGAYAAFLPDTAGAEVNVRTPDGIHLTPGGGARLATAVAGAMQTQLHVHLLFGKAVAGSRT
jgi:hypothetical protein